MRARSFRSAPLCPGLSAILAALLAGAPALPASAQTAGAPFRASGTVPAAPPHAESSAAIGPENYEVYVARLEAVEAIKRLIASFGYYRSANLPAETAALFAADGTADFDGGQWRGKDGLLRLFSGRYRQNALVGTSGPQRGVLSESYVMQPVIDVAADGRAASARFREIQYWGEQGKSQLYGAMLHEAIFTREGDVWAFRSLVSCQSWQTDYAKDLSQGPLPPFPKAAPVRFPKSADGPDRLSSQFCVPWPFGGITPRMHYPHPVTGEPINKP